MQSLVNIAIGEVNGIYEHTFIKVVSTLPLVIENITTKNAIINRKVIGITDVLMSSSFDAVDPIAPYIKAYIRKPKSKLEGLIHPLGRNVGLAKSFYKFFSAI